MPGCHLILHLFSLSTNHLCGGMMKDGYDPQQGSLTAALTLLSLMC